MGADVIKIEPPGGDGARNIGPFVDDLPHRDRSLFFWFYNLNKRSMTLDLAPSARARAVFADSRSGADVVIESFDARRRCARWASDGTPCIASIPR